MSAKDQRQAQKALWFYLLPYIFTSESFQFGSFSLNQKIHLATWERREGIFWLITQESAKKNFKLFNKIGKPDFRHAWNFEIWRFGNGRCPEMEKALLLAPKKILPQTTYHKKRVIVPKMAVQTSKLAWKT